jgi:short-subunit dehydrogenase
VAGRVVVITGASLGVGRATAREFARRGDRVALLARPAESLERAREDVEQLGTEALAVPVDVADHDAVDAAAATVEGAWGPIDVWVNNAMTSVFAPARTLSGDEVRRVTEVTYLGTVHGTLAALRRMVPRDHGTIVQVGSALAYRAIPLQAAYCGAKHAARGFTDAVRCELLHEGSRVRITTVHLPAINTPQFQQVRTRLPRQAQPVPPIFQPEVAAKAIVWASEHPRRELFVGWSSLKAVFLNKAVPALADRYLARTAYDGQQTDEPVPNDPVDNLTEPLPGDLGAHGLFDDDAKPRSIHLLLTMHRRALAGAGLALAGAGAGLLRGRRSSWR